VSEGHRYPLVMFNPSKKKASKQSLLEYLPVPNETAPPPRKTPRGDTLDATCTSLSRIDPCHVSVRSVFQIQNRILRFFGQPEKNAILGFYDLA